MGDREGFNQINPKCEIKGILLYIYGISRLKKNVGEKNITNMEREKRQQGGQGILLLVQKCT